MSSIAADSVAAQQAPASRPMLDKKPGPATIAVFVLLLVVGIGYTLFSLVTDISGAMPHRMALLPFILLGVALLIALGFEFVNGFHDTANAVATVIYTHSLPPHVAVVWSGHLQLPRRAGLQRRGRLRHHHAAAGGADPAGRLERRLCDGVRAADRRHRLESRHLVAGPAGLLLAHADRLHHRRRRRQRADARP